MTLRILVEGKSEKEFLDRWCARAGVGTVSVFPHEGRGTLPRDPSVVPDPKVRTLLNQLPAKLRGFMGSGIKDPVVVLVDSDDDDPIVLRTDILAMAASIAPALNVLVCVAVEELEAFYLGDLRALERSYPEADMQRARAYDPDSIVGTWELFGEIINDDSGDKVGLGSRDG